MSTAELKELVTSLVPSQKQTDHQIEQTGLKTQEIASVLEALGKETDKQLRELGKQIGGLGNKFGRFTEGLAYPSLERILREKFGMNDVISPNVIARYDGLEVEYDILAYSAGTRNAGMVVEIKSSLRNEDIDQMTRKMEGFFRSMPMHRGMTFQGMVACVAGSIELKQEVLKNGWHLAHIGEDLFELETPANFIPKLYVANS